MTIDKAMIKALKIINKLSKEGVEGNVVNTYGVNHFKYIDICIKNGIKRIDEVIKYLFDNKLITVIFEADAIKDISATIAISPEGVLFLIQVNNLKWVKRSIWIAFIALVVSVLSFYSSLSSLKKTNINHKNTVNCCKSC